MVCTSIPPVSPAKVNNSTGSSVNLAPESRKDCNWRFTHATILTFLN